MIKKTAKIELGGKERTFYFGLGFLGLFIENSGIDIKELDKYISANPFKAIPELMYNSLSYGYLRQDLEPDFNLFLVSEWIDESGGASGEPVLLFLKAFKESMNSNLPAIEEKKTRAQRRAPAKKK